MHRKRQQQIFAIYLLLAAGLLGLMQCESTENVTEISGNIVTCEGCHTNEDVLATLAPETGEEEQAGGG